MCYSCCLFFTYRYRSCSFRFQPSFHSFFSLCFFCDEWCLYVSLLPFVFNVFSHVYCVVLVFICSNRILCFIIALCVCQLMPMCFHVVVALLNLECPLWLYIYIYTYVQYTYHCICFANTRIRFLFLSLSVHHPFSFHVQFIYHSCSFLFLSFPFTSFHVSSPFSKKKIHASLSQKFQTKAIALLFLFLSCFSGHVSDFFPTNLQKKRVATPFFLSFWRFAFMSFHCSSFLLGRVKQITRLHHLSWVFDDFCLCPSIFLHFCWDVLPKKLGYIFVGTNDKNCGHSMF